MPVAEHIYDAQGLRIVRNAVNQFIVCTCHFTADPAKRDPAWRRVAAAGMTPGQAARELDIDYTAVQGSKVFPEFAERRSLIVVPRFDPADLAGLKMWAGLDYGTRNPASVHVYTIIDDVIFSLWELYEPCRDIPEWVAKVKACPYWRQVRYVAADPSLWVPTQQQAYGGPVGVETLLRQAGLTNLIKGRNDEGAEQAWVGMLRQAWAQPETTFRISEDCPHQIREFETAIFQPQSERQLMTSGVYAERIADRDNHSLDDCKYFMLTMPKAKTSFEGGWKDPGQVYKMLGGGRQNTHRPHQGRGPVGYA